MARPKKIKYELVEKAKEIVGICEDIDELRKAQAILLPAIMGATLEKTALILGVSRASVHRLQVRFQHEQTIGKIGKPSTRNWGGRRYSLLTIDEEKEFLAPWAEKAKTGGILVVSVIRAALGQRVGRNVKPSVVYRLLERHGWRKVAPDTHHPKSDPKIQEEWKKNSRKIWLPF